MIVLGHPKIPSPTLRHITDASQIARVAAKDIVWFDFDLDLLRFCHENDVRCAVRIADEKEAVYANALGAVFLLCGLKLAARIQKIADHYLFDAKVIVPIDERIVDEAIEAGVDGVLLTNYGRV